MEHEHSLQLGFTEGFEQCIQTSAVLVINTISKELITMTMHQPLTSRWVRRMAAASLLAGLATGAMAQSTAPSASVATPPTSMSAATAHAVQVPQLTIRDVYDRLEAAGYRDLREIEWSDGRYEVKARNAQGARVKLEIDGNTGAVLRNRIKH
jgi:hypothetical protein